MVTDVTAADRPTSLRFDLVTVLLSVWMVGGVFVDGWAHINLASTKETFFTPWHGVLYSGFTAVAAWMTWPVLRSRSAGLPRRFPVGYGLAFVGLVVFAAGGVGDAIWHTVLGIEIGIDALLSPTHILLLFGGLLVLTSPVRAAWRSVDDPSPSLRELLPALVALTLTAALVAFFFAYAWGAFDLSPSIAVPVAALDENAPGHAEAERAIAFGILSRIVTTLVLLGPLLFITRRWRLPVGAFTTMFATVSLLLFGMIEPPAALLAAAILTGVGADLALAALGPRRGDLWVIRGLVAGTALLFWSLHFGALAVTDGIGWPPELWGGAIAMSVLAAFGAAVLATPPPAPAADGVPFDAPA